MNYRRKTVEKWKYDAWRLGVAVIVASVLIGRVAMVVEAKITGPLISPLADVHKEYVEVIVDVPDETVDRYVADAVDEFFSGSGRESEVKMLLHCLLHRESRHGESKAHGDNGKAGGPMQFHESTWVRMRKQMGEDLSSRYNLKESIRTTAWAIKNGNAREWGPIYRDSKGSTFASCPTPSWYR